MKETSSTLVLANISKRFGGFSAVNDVTIAIKPGEVVGFVGPNGAGKTTTISMIMGFIAPSRGHIELFGHKLQTQSAHETHKKIGYVAGDMVLPAHLTAAQYLRFCASTVGRNDERYEQLVHQLNPVLDRPLRQLSRGNKQKIALISALQHGPQMLVLDEPTAGLDPLMQESFLRTIRHEAKRGTTIFLSSHILSEISDVCSRIVFMKKGKFIVDKPINSLTAHLGKQVVITSRSSANLIKYLPETVTLLSHTGSTVRLTVPVTELKLFMRWLTTKSFEDVTIEDRDLDDLFHELYIPKFQEQSR